VNYACPRDRAPLTREADELRCAEGHAYPVVDHVPLLLLEEEAPTHAACQASLTPRAAKDDPDALVQDVIAATCGNLYRHLIGNVTRYPIPELRLPDGEGRRFLEIGCNWGRWCVSAARRGYEVVGVDPSLVAIRAAKRVAEQVGVSATYVVADARHLPFPDHSFDVVFSYSVFQHFAREDALASFDEVGRVLRPGGLAMIQMANVWGARSLWNQLRERRFREPRDLFDVHYWGPEELRGELTRRVGPTEIAADGFFTLNPQMTDLELFPRRYRAVVRTSEALRRASERVRPLRYAADSLYALSRGGPAA
jgi:SAM-dependent methyltransferase